MFRTTFPAGVAVALMAASAPASQSRTPVRTVLVTVTDAQGGPVVGLTPDDFVLQRDEAPVVVFDVAPARYPLLIAVDTGAGARDIITRVREPLRDFAERSALSPMALLTFGDTPIVVVRFTDEVPRMARGLDQLFARPDTASYLMDGLHRVADEVRRLQSATSLVVVVAADSFDSSRRDTSQVIQELRQSGARVHVVVQQPLTGATMSAPPPRSQRSRTAADSLLQAARERGAILEDVAKATGGSFQQVHLESGLQAALDAIRQQVLGEYVLSYGGPPDGTDDSSLRLRVKLPGVQVSMWPLAARPSPRAQP